MIDTENIQNKVLYLATKSDKCIRKAVQNKMFMQLFGDEEVSQFVAGQFVSWYKKYNERPSLKRVYEKYKDTDWGPKLNIRFRVIHGLSKDAPQENEFDSYVDELKMNWVREKFTEKLQNYAGLDSASAKDVNMFSEQIKEFGNEFVKISNDIMSVTEGEYSHTTEESQENVEKIKEKDISNEKRFMIGHRPFDKATKGLRPGELMMVLANVNQGKSMVLANIAYNAWKNGANVFLLTHEMQPFEFDERIYSRASAIDYNNILDGKDYLTETDKIAFDEMIKVMKESKNRIVTKFLQKSDNIGTIENYLEDLKMTRDFVPDVIIVDSLEHISPMHAPAESKEHQIIGSVIDEFKDFAQRKEFIVISSHQAKTESNEKKFEDLSITEFGRTKVAAEKPDFAIYIRSITEFSLMNVKLIKARRAAAGVTWSMAIDFSKCLVTDTRDETNSESFIDESGNSDMF